MKFLFILKMGDAAPELVLKYGNYEDQFLLAMELPPYVAQVINVPMGMDFPAFETIAGLVITGSLSNITEEQAWMKRAVDWVGRAVRAGVPTLGVCFGHQLMGAAHGARVGFNPRGLECGTIDVDLTEDGNQDVLLEGLESPFHAQASHAQSLLSLPEGAVCLAYNDHEPFHALRYGKRAWSFQFHPEWNEDIMRAGINVRRTDLQANGLEPDVLMSMVASSTPARQILTRFAELIRDDLNM